MIRRIGMVGAAALVAGNGVVLTGCGSSASRQHHSTAAHTVTLSSGQALVEAADTTNQASGYRMDARLTVTVGSTSVAIRMQGVIEQHGTVGALTSHETVAGHEINLQIRVAHQIYYMRSPVAHGKRWLSFNLAEAQQAEGLGGLQGAATSNPSQFLSYLRAVGSGIERVGSATIRGTPTTEYRATLDLDRYTRLVPQNQRAAARATIARLETEIGGHTLPITVWIDGHHEVRQMHLKLPVCIQDHRISMSMTMDVFDFGRVPPVSMPPASETENITGKLKAALRKQHAMPASCPASSA